MKRILLVANQTLGGKEVNAWLRERITTEPCEVHVLVPANVDPPGWVHDEDSDRELAQRRLEDAMGRLSDLGVPVTGEVGDERPVDAVLDVLRDATFDEVVLSTLPVGMSRWVRQDVVHRIERAVSIPVTHIVAARAPAGAS